MSRKAKSCYNCPAHTESYCLLGYQRNYVFENVKGPKGIGHIVICSPKECCHKPKTVKEFSKRYAKR